MGYAHVCAPQDLIFGAERRGAQPGTTPFPLTRRIPWGLQARRETTVVSRVPLFVARGVAGELDP